MKAGKLDFGCFRDLRAAARPLSELKFDLSKLPLTADADGDDGGMLPASRDSLWQEMLQHVLGYVPEGAEKAPPCNCELAPLVENYQFAGLAGLPPAIRLMDGFFPVRNQSKRGACFAFALVALCEYMLGKTVELSEQSLFHFTKLVTPGDVDDVSDGAIALDAIHAVEEYGICPLSEWHYNPESWNYVEDPYNEGQGAALQRKLAAAQKYRFRHWRMLSQGSVLQFKQALSAGFPIYTGVATTKSWTNDSDVRKNGVIPYPKAFWYIHITPPPVGLAMKVLEENGVEPDEESIMMAVSGLMRDTFDYVKSAVFGCQMKVCNQGQDENGIWLVVLLDVFTGGHALCLAGYVDNPEYPGGGYFIARNSWSDTEWAPESPEMPGYALIPYAYIADLGSEGVVMSEFPEAGVAAGVGAPPISGVGGMHLNASAAGTRTDAGVGASRPSWLGSLLHRAPAGGPIGRVASSVPSAAAPYPSMRAAQAATAQGTIPHVPTFEEWLKEREAKMEGVDRDSRGILLRPGDSILLPYPPHKKVIYKDTPDNREALRPIFETEKAKILAEIERIRQIEEARKAAAEQERLEREAAAEKERQEREAAAEQERRQREVEMAKANEKRLHDSVKAIVEDSLNRLIPPDAEIIREGLLKRCPDLQCPSLEWITDAMHELVAQYPGKYKIGTSFDGRFEEIQKVCKN